MFDLILFLLFSLALAWYSWPYLREPGSARMHGFYRFFAWEGILALVLLNRAAWFREPFTLRQFVSWLVLAASIGLALHGFRNLRRIGRPAGPFENTTQLVTAGAYRWIRHPLYTSLILLALGAFLKQPNLTGTTLLAVTAAFLYATARVEEGEMIDKFGDSYRLYRSQTRMFIPYLF